MTTLTFQGAWNAAKGRLRQTYARLTHDSLLFALGQDEERLGRLQQQISAAKAKLRRSIATLPRSDRRPYTR